MVTKLLILEVDKEVIVPRVIRSDVKEMLVREVGIDGVTGSVRGEGRDKFGKDERFLSLGCCEFKIVFLKDNNPSGKFAINFSTVEKVLHRVGICYDLSCAKQNVMM